MSAPIPPPPAPPPPSFAGTPPAFAPSAPPAQAAPAPALSAPPPQAPSAPPPQAPSAPPAHRPPETIEAEPVAVSYETLPVEYLGEPASELVPATSGNINWSADFKDIAAQQGFDDLDFTTYGIWPIVSLDRGVFKVSTGGDLGREFMCQIQQKRKKMLFSNGINYGQDGAAAVYSYDGETASGSGKPLKEVMAGWAKVDKREYLELVCRLPDSKIILLSVPPQSISRFVAFVADTIAARVLVAEAWCKVGIGARITNARVPFDPISFELVRQ